MAESSREKAALSERPIGRREVLAGAGMVAAVAAAGMARAAEHEGHAGHEGHGVPAAQPKYSAAARYKKHATLVAATNDCIAKGQACISHCMETFLAGETTMAECAFAVQQMLHVCDAMAYLAAYDSPNLKPMAQACIAVCDTCEKACREHEEHQEECKACADACAAVIKEAKKVLA